jgi:hypothetical protein
MNDPVGEFCLQKGYAQHVVEGGLDYLITSWEKTSTEIATGYSFGFDDFLNDMDGRQILSDVLQVATEEQKRSIESRLIEADKLFMASTIESVACIWDKANEEQLGYSREKNWYYYRTPIGLPDWSITMW